MSSWEQKSHFTKTLRPVQVSQTQTKQKEPTRWSILCGLRAIKNRHVRRWRLHHKQDINLSWMGTKKKIQNIHFFCHWTNVNCIMQVVVDLNGSSNGHVPRCFLMLLHMCTKKKNKKRGRECRQAIPSWISWRPVRIDYEFFGCI